MACNRSSTPFVLGCRFVMAMACGEGSILADRAVLMEGLREVVEAVPTELRLLRLSFCATRSGFSLSLPRNRAKKPWDGLLVLGDRWAILSSRGMSEKELGVGLEGRPSRLVFEAKAELRADGWFRRALCGASSRLVVGRSV